MFSSLRDRFINFITSRMIYLFFMIVILFGILCNRLYQLQIVKGHSYEQNFKLKTLKEQSISSTRGKIYDVNGVLLAYDELTYAVTMEDNYFATGSEKNRLMNETIVHLIQILEAGNYGILNDFQIGLDDNGEYVYKVEGTQLLRFLADIYGRSKISDLKVKEKMAGPSDVITYLCSNSKFGIGSYVEKEDGSYEFTPEENLDRELLLKVISIRYALSLNSFQKYISTTIATGLDENTVAIIMENKGEMQGVDIIEDTIRRYINEPSMSPILGYTGIISQEELDSYNEEGNNYERNDMVGHAGVEQVAESYLKGEKGYRKVFVDNMGRVINVAEYQEPEAGNDLYLTIDSKLQAAIYKILEQKLAGIVVSHIRNEKDYGVKEHTSASDIMIPIDDVYNALFNNGVISIPHLAGTDAGKYEKQIYSAFVDKQNRVFSNIRMELTNLQTPYGTLNREYQVYESAIVNLLASQSVGILVPDRIDETDEIYISWKNETISLSEYLRHAIACEWIDVTRLHNIEQYSDSDEVYRALVDETIELLASNDSFSRKIMKYMIQRDEISGKQIGMVLFEQGIIIDDVDTRSELDNGLIEPYNFMLEKIRKLEITPAQLALDPCTASCVITDVQTGEVRACVSYPSYDNNRMANTIDADYYNKLRNDLSNPLYSYATQQKTAPGSTYKIVSAMAGVREHVINIGETIECVGQYDKMDNPKCWKFPGSHGRLDVTGAITNSCNFFFYEDGYRLGIDSTGRYSSDLGLEKLEKYANEFGLSEKSGIELSEAEPQISTEDSVRSAIGQGTNSFSTVQLARYVNTVANSGICYNISLLDKVVDTEGNVVEDFTPKIRNRIEASDDLWRAIHSGMHGVVREANAFKDSGVDAAGKTGTAQQVKTRPNHALFIGYAPYDDPEISIATRIAYGYTSANAAESARDVFQYYFNIRDKDDILTGEATVPTSGTISD